MLGCAAFDFAPFGLSGTVYGTLLNQRSALVALGDAVNQKPYLKPPRAPILYVKPRNTLAGEGHAVPVPADSPELEVGATLGVVIGRPVCRVSETQALDTVAGYLIVNDVSVPHASYYRPSIRQKARDGFCPLGAATARESVGDPGALGIRVFVDGKLAASASTADLLRSVPRLLADVSEFMTLSPGDVLAVGVAAPAPRVRAGAQVRIEIDKLGALNNRFVAEQL
ncbi:MAG: fumarylacetoacetate hydrolase family protein [Proteobacteria bacterium]|nr:fumarylacetoacetate hydrolase family protein [Pseudomonadota bacterium]